MFDFLNFRHTFELSDLSYFMLVFACFQNGLCYPGFKNDAKIEIECWKD